MKLHCPFRKTSVGCLFVPIKVGADHPPFSYTPDGAINRILKHIKRDHSMDDITTFFEDYLAQEYHVLATTAKEAS